MKLTKNVKIYVIYSSYIFIAIRAQLNVLKKKFIYVKAHRYIVLCIMHVFIH